MRYSKKTKMYLRWLSELFPGTSWRQFYVRCNGGIEPEWFYSPNYRGAWLDKEMGEEAF